MARSPPTTDVQGGAFEAEVVMPLSRPRLGSGRYGIRCNTVLPGFIRSPMTDKVPQKVLDKFAGMVPLGRLGEPEDVADVCAFLASEDSRYITGASVEVTGGLFA